jgi:hypothetical protein
MKTPKEKARDLVNTFYYALPNNGSQEGLNSTTRRYAEGIRCALIAVDEIINYLEVDGFSTQINYWQEVKQEIELL